MSLRSDRDLLTLMEMLALDAGRRIMEIKQDGWAIETKADESPVTIADREGEEIILRGLRDRFPEIPIVAEEEAAAGLCQNHTPAEFFLVDPLDGTKEFIKGSGDFTVNIALIRSGVPVLGVVYAPVSHVLYGGGAHGAEAITTNANHEKMVRRNIAARQPATPLTIVASRSHLSPETSEIIAQHPGADLVSVGSSLKFCMIASGAADLYPRLSPTMQWDTAAGDAVLRAAGGRTTTLDGELLTYGAKGGEKPYLNPWFIAEGVR